MVELELAKSSKKVTWGEFIHKRKLRQALIVTVLVQMSQKLTGKFEFLEDYLFYDPYFEI